MFGHSEGRESHQHFPIYQDLRFYDPSFELNVHEGAKLVSSLTGTLTFSVRSSLNQYLKPLHSYIWKGFPKEAGK